MTKIFLDDEVRKRIKIGIDKLADVVKLTLGPGGQNVALKLNHRRPTITKDGVSVARVIELEDPVENVGAQLVKEVALKTVYTVGDGTTTATVLAQAIYSAGLKHAGAGANMIELKRGIDLAVQDVVKSIAIQSCPISGRDQIKAIASISVNNDEEIGEMVAEAMDRVGPDGLVSLDESRSFESSIKVVEGLQFQQGYMSPQFVTNQDKMNCVLENPKILITGHKINIVKDVIKALEAASQANSPLLIIADDYEAEALAALVVNKLRGAISVCAVKAPSYGDTRTLIMNDIGILTGGEPLNEDNGKKLDKLSSNQLGSCDRVIVTKDSTMIIKGHGKPEVIEAHKNNLKAQIENSMNDMEKDQIRERLAKLSGGIAVILVGGKTETEMKEKKDRVEDAIHATKAAVDEGIIPGGGVAYIHSILGLNILLESKDLSDDQRLGIQIVRTALESPMSTICTNAIGAQTDAVAMTFNWGKQGRWTWGYNARLRRHEDLVEAGIIDPAKVARLALENAASIAGMLLTTKAIVYENPEPARAHNPYQ